MPKCTSRLAGVAKPGGAERGVKSADDSLYHVLFQRAAAKDICHAATAGTNMANVLPFCLVEAFIARSSLRLP